MRKSMKSNDHRDEVSKGSSFLLAKLPSIFLLSVAVFSVFLLPACSSRGRVPAGYAALAERPDILYNEGLTNFAKRNYYQAAKKFGAIEKRYASSAWAKRAILMEAYCNYLQRHYDETVATAQRYLDVYSATPQAAYAAYLIGLGHFAKIANLANDQKEAQQTVEAMQKLIKDYPHSEYVADAQVKIRLAREQLAAKEMQVGRFYQFRHKYLAALKRYREVVKDYAGTNQIEEALFRLVEVDYALGVMEEARTTAWMLAILYPKGYWYAHAYALLQNNNLQPALVPQMQQPKTVMARQPVYGRIY